VASVLALCLALIAVAAPCCPLAVGAASGNAGAGLLGLLLLSPAFFVGNALAVVCWAISRTQSALSAPLRERGDAVSFTASVAWAWLVAVAGLAALGLLGYFCLEALSHERWKL